MLSGVVRDRDALNPPNTLKMSVLLYTKTS